MTDEQARDEAAERHHGVERGNWGPDFKAGWTAALKGPAVTALVEALETIYKEAANGDGTTTECEMAALADNAIHEFNKARGAE